MLLITIFLPDNFPEFSSDLVAALTSLEMDNFSHLDTLCEISRTVLVVVLLVTEAGSAPGEDYIAGVGGKTGYSSTICAITQVQVTTTIHSARAVEQNGPRVFKHLYGAF